MSDPSSDRSSSLESSPAIKQDWYCERVPATADSVAAPDLVLLHGWGMSAAVWRHWLPLLRRRCNVILLDLPGFGRSPAQLHLSVDELCDQLREYIPKGAALLGWSLGGNLALAFDERFPGHCRALLTLACNPSFIAHGDWLPGMPADMFRQFQSDLAEHPGRTLRRFLGLQTHGSDGERQLARWLRDVGAGSANNSGSANDSGSAGNSASADSSASTDNSGNYPQVLQWGLRILAQLDVRAALQNCKLPGVHIYGSADALVPSAVARAVGVLNPEHWVVLIDRAAHLPFVSHAELCWQHLDRLLASARLLQRPRPHLRAKAAVAASFSRAAATYDSAAALQRAVADNLLADFAAPAGGTVLDLGCGTGAATALLAGHHAPAERPCVVALDLAEGMLRFARTRTPAADSTHWLCGDAENLPLADGSIDAAFSSLAVQWCENLGAVFAELQRVLRPGASAWLSTLGPATLHELRDAWAAVDDRVHVNQFVDREKIVEAVQRAGLALTACNESILVMRYAELRELTRELKALGAHNVNHGRPGGLLTRRQLQQFSTAYEAQRTADGSLPATYQVYYLQLTKPLTMPVPVDQPAL
jgi:malonyl-CoA O-methyltransferase